ncbi:MAG TPA: 23S rRNA (adenine(2030)-N(6))-methyltransferase RlmJ [Candidatus Competibacteraceae bacterium]|nr:23S rRNA (adenine(2030)-N(6))-methyltransferase RlmJ [Candidatus Competibacteraceae bacterium]
MFGYRHSFHAGNFADVFKHAVLVQLLLALRRKEAPFCVLDTHAGIGRYDLAADFAQKTGEYRDGIGRLWDCGDTGAELAAYRERVREFNGPGRLRAYPGSPRIARALLRQQDRLILCELNPADHALLKREFQGDPQVAVHCQDGYAALKAFTPPKERRGLVLIDPPFEQAGEFQRLLDGLRLLAQRWPGGVVAAWYPIIGRRDSERFLVRAGELGLPKLLCAELGLYPYDVPLGMSGCGMLIVNTPWQLDQALQRLLPELLSRLRRDHPGQTRLEWLTRE